MARTFKQPPKQNLIRLPVLIEDVRSYSDYFQVSDLNTVFHAGKNGFLLRGSEFLKRNTQVFVEVLDRFDNPVFTTAITNFSEGGARLISTEIFERTERGAGKLVIVGTADRYSNGTTIPTSQTQTPNVRWVVPIVIEPNNQNTTKIRLSNSPIATVAEKNFTTTRIDRVTTTDSTYTASVVYDYEVHKSDGYAITMLDSSSTPVNYFDEINIDGYFTGSIYKLEAYRWYDSGVEVPVSYSVVTDYVTSSVYLTLDKILNQSTAITNKPIKFTDKTDFLNPILKSGSYERILETADLGNNVEKRLVEQITSSVTFQYVSESTVQVPATSSIVSFRIPFVGTHTGQIAKVKIGAKEANDNITSFQPFAEFVPTEKNILVTSSAIGDTSIGRFLENSTLQDNWFGGVLKDTSGTFNQSEYESNSASSYPRTVLTSSVKILEGAYVDHTSGSGTSYYFGTKNFYQLYNNVEYTLKYSAVYTPTYVSGSDTYSTTSTGSLKTYLTRIGSSQVARNSSSVVVNDETPYGQLVDTVNTRTVDKSLYEREVNFTVPKNGVAYLRFVVDSGFWNFGDIQITPAIEKGFNPDEIIFDAENNFLKDSTNQFKIQFLNFNDEPIDYEIITNPLYVSGSRAVKNFKLITDRTQFTFTGSSASPTAQTASIESELTNIVSTPTFTVVDDSGSAVNASFYKVTGGNLELYPTAFGADTASILVTATVETFTDKVRVVKVTSGADGADGQDGITSILTVSGSSTFISSSIGISTEPSASTVFGTLLRGASTIASITSSITGSPTVGMEVGSVISSSLDVSGSWTVTATTGSAKTGYQFNFFSGSLSPTTVNTKDFNVSIQGIDGVDGAAGTSGSDARSIKLTLNDYSVVYSQFGTNPTPTSLTASAEAQNLSGSNFTYNFYRTGSLLSTITTGSSFVTASFVVPTIDDYTSQVIEVQVSESATGVARDTVNFFGVTPGIDGFTVILSNQNHTFPADSSGIVSTFVGGGTDIEVLYGDTNLTPTSTTPTDSQFSASVSQSSNVTPNTSSSIEDVYIRYGPPTAMSEDSGSITYKITAVTGSLTQTFIQTQTFTKSRKGADPQTTNLIVSGSTTFVSSSTGVSSPSTTAVFGSLLVTGSVLASITSSITGSPTVGMTVGSVISSSNALSGSWSVTATTGSTTTGYQFTLFSGSSSPTTVNTKDFNVNIQGVDGINGSNGSNAKVVSLTANPGYVVTYQGDGTKNAVAITLTATEQNHSGTVYYDFTQDGTSRQNTTSNTYTIPDGQEPAANTSDLWQVDTREGASTGTIIAFDNIDIFGVQDGTDAKTIRLSSDYQAFTEAVDGTVTPSSIAFTVSKQNTSNNISWTTSPSITLYDSAVGGSSITQGSLIATNPVYMREASPSFGANTDVTVTATVTDGSTLTDEITIVRLVQGRDGIVVVNTNQAHTAPADYDGANADLTNSKTTIKVFEGATELAYDGVGTANGTWTVSISQNPSSTLTVGGITDNGDNITIGDHSAMVTGTDSVVITYTLTGKKLDGTAFSIDTTQTITKSKGGEDAYTVFLTNEAHSFPAANDGTVAGGDLTAGAFEVRFFKGATQYQMDQSSPYSSNTYRVSVVTSGITVSGPGGGTQAVYTPTAVSADTGTVTVTIIDNANSTTFIKTYTFNRTRKGDPGTDAVTIELTPSSQTVTKDVVDNTYASPTTFVVSVRDSSGAFSYDASLASDGTFRVGTVTNGSNSSGTITPSAVTVDGGLTVTVPVEYRDNFGNTPSAINKIHTINVVFDGSTGPGIVFTGEYDATRILYQYDLSNGRRDAVRWYNSTQGDDYFYATLQANGTGTGAGAQSPADGGNSYWEELGEEDFFVAAKIAIFEQSFVQNTLNVGSTDNGGLSSANITLYGTDEYPYFSLGQSATVATQEYGANGIFIGRHDDTKNTDATDGAYVMSLVNGTTSYLKWTGTSLDIKGDITATGGSFDSYLTVSSNVYLGLNSLSQLTNPTPSTANMPSATNAVVNGSYTTPTCTSVSFVGEHSTNHDTGTAALGTSPTAGQQLAITINIDQIANTLANGTNEICGPNAYLGVASFYLRIYQNLANDTADTLQEDIFLGTHIGTNGAGTSQGPNLVVYYGVPASTKVRFKIYYDLNYEFSYNFATKQLFQYDISTTKVTPNISIGDSGIFVNTGAGPKDIIASALSTTGGSGGGGSQNIASTSQLGIVKLGYTDNNKNYAVEIDGNNDIYVNVPWTDTNTTYTFASGDAQGQFKVDSTNYNITTLQSTSSPTFVTVNAALNGNASTATKWATGRTITLTGDVTGTSGTFDGSGNLSFATTIAANSVALGTDTTGNYVQQGATSGNGISGAVNSEGGTFTVTSNATNANTASTIVFRDASGNFSAGTITAALNGNASTATSATSAATWTTARTLTIGDTGKSVNGGGNVTWSRTEIGITKTNIDALNINADTLDGIQGASYLRSDADDTFTRLSGARVSCGYDSGNDNSIGCSNWFYSSGTTGWYNASYSGGIYMADSTWVRVYNNKQFYSQNYIQSDSSVRAPIFYDSNNTGYYTDPASTSVLNAVYASNIYNNGLGSGYYFTQGDWGWRHQTPYGWIQFGPANTSYAHIYTDRGNFYLNVYDLYLNGNLVPAYGYSRTGDLYASSFKDSNDSSYYLDPNGASNLAGTVTNNGQDQTFVAQSNGSGATWYGRILSKNSTVDRAAFLGVWGSTSAPGVFAHNNALNSWSTLYINTVDVSGGGNVIICGSSGGVVSIGNSNTTYKLDVSGTIRATDDVIVTSDIRLKNELPDTVQGLESVDKIRPIKYTLKSDEDENPKTHLGFSAQELLDIVPEVVNTDNEGYHSVSYQKLVPVLVKAIQELTEEVRELKKKIGE